MLDTKDIIDNVLKNKSSNNIITFLNSLFEVEIVAHIAHLQTKSYAQHISEKISLAEQTRTKLSDGYLQQVIDDVIELYTSTLYKLKNLS